MKQRISKGGIARLSAKYLQAKLQLGSAGQKAKAAALRARAMRKRQKLAKKAARTAREHARLAEADLRGAERVFAKAEARLVKARKKAAKETRAAKPTKVVARQPRRRPARPTKVAAAFTRNAASSAAFPRAPKRQVPLSAPTVKPVTSQTLGAVSPPVPT